MNTIQDHLAASGWDAAALATHFGVPVDSMSAYLEGRVPFPGGIRVLVAELLGLNEISLMRLTGEGKSVHAIPTPTALKDVLEEAFPGAVITSTAPYTARGESNPTTQVLAPSGKELLALLQRVRGSWGQRLRADLTAANVDDHVIVLVGSTQGLTPPTPKRLPESVASAMVPRKAFAQLLLGYWNSALRPRALMTLFGEDQVRSWAEYAVASTLASKPLTLLPETKLDPSLARPLEVLAGGHQSQHSGALTRAGRRVEGIPHRERLQKQGFDVGVAEVALFGFCGFTRIQQMRVIRPETQVRAKALGLDLAQVFEGYPLLSQKDETGYELPLASFHDHPVYDFVHSHYQGFADAARQLKLGENTLRGAITKGQPALSSKATEAVAKVHGVEAARKLNDAIRAYWPRALATIPPKTLSDSEVMARTQRLRKAAR